MPLCRPDERPLALGAFGAAGVTAGFDAAEGLAALRASFGVVGAVPDHYWWVFFGGLGLIAALGLLSRPARRRPRFGGETSGGEPRPVAQRRGYMRLAPHGALALKCRVAPAPGKHFQEPVEILAQAEVLDISLGGARLFFNTPLNLDETERFVGLLDLPLTGLENPGLAKTSLTVLMQPLTHDQPPAGQEDQGRTVRRVKFLGRYRRQDDGLWRYTPFTALLFQDLAYWMQACHRLQLKKEHGLLPPSAFERPANRFPSVPPERPPLRYDQPDEPEDAPGHTE